MKFPEIKIQAVIAVIVVLGGMSIITFTQVNDADRIGLFSLMSVVLGYYFGSSKSSATKDDSINELSKKN